MAAAAADTLITASEAATARRGGHYSSGRFIEFSTASCIASPIPHSFIAQTTVGQTDVDVHTLDLRGFFCRVFTPAISVAGGWKIKLASRKSAPCKTASDTYAYVQARHNVWGYLQASELAYYTTQQIRFYGRADLPKVPLNSLQSSANTLLNVNSAFRTKL